MKTTVRQSRAVITDRGMVAPLQIQVLANRCYYLGASDSPDHIFVVSVTEDRIGYVRTSGLKLEGDIREMVSYIQRWIGEDLIRKGCRTRLARTLRAAAQYNVAWAQAEIVKLQAILDNRDPGVENIAYYVVYTVTVRAVNPPTGTLTRETDPWYAAEVYGGVAGLVGVPWTYEINGVTGAMLHVLEKDAAFAIIGQ